MKQRLKKNEISLTPDFYFQKAKCKSGVLQIFIFQRQNVKSGILQIFNFLQKIFKSGVLQIFIFIKIPKFDPTFKISNLTYSRFSFTKGKLKIWSTSDLDFFKIWSSPDFNFPLAKFETGVLQIFIFLLQNFESGVLQIFIFIKIWSD